MSAVPQSGKVFLVGGGPGDPGLLTLRGRKCLEAADLVLYDGLVSPLLLRHTRATCERTSRAAGPHGKQIPQAEINARLIAAAKEGKTVVRLKGGDPFLFGRGSEEALALAEAGVAFEVVPGVTAAVAAAAYAGLSLTHREMASSVAFITGHEDPSKAEATIDYAHLARFPGTLVFYMGLNRLAQIASVLIAAGKDASTPSCVISRATTPHQRTVEGPLGELWDRVQAAGLHAPSLIIVGECVRQRSAIAWYEQRPLLGKRIGVTRPEHQSDGVVDQLLTLGAEPVLMPLIEVRPISNWAAVDDAIARLSTFDWLIFTSVNGVDAFLGRVWDTGGDLRRLADPRIAAIGPATAARLGHFHLRADIVPDEFCAEGLVKTLSPIVEDQRVLWAGADRGREVLSEGLALAGANVEKIATYRSCDVTSLPASTADLLSRGEIDWIGLSSPSIARGLATLLPAASRPHLGSRIRLASISPITSEAARAVGLPISAEATEFTWSGLIEAILRCEDR